MASSTVDSHVWKACAGTSTQIPTVGSRVYYFPQGHAEQSYSPPDLSSLYHKSPPFVLCRIGAVQFLADNNTDEVFTKLRLHSEPLSPRSLPVTKSVSTGSSDGGDPPVVSFAKILTPSDANNGGGFSVPRFCADSIFPPLDYNADPPVQTITVRDVHGMAYDFRHIYRGTPRRHLLTTGWSKFVNQKKLVAGDSVVFVKNRSGELFVGVRRAARFVGDCGRWSGAKVEEDSGGFSRSGKGRVSPESVVEAAGLACSGRAFEVVYYPRAGSPNFVVLADEVENVMSMYWVAGMRVKMAVETEDSSRMTWFQGTVTSIAPQELGQWQGSPWRMLQVAWDEPEVVQNGKRVSPWQVELVSTSPQLQASFAPAKKMRHSISSEILNDGEDPVFFPVMGLSTVMMEHLNPSLFNYNTFPAGMQGARHDTMGVSSLTNSIPNNHRLYSGNLYQSNMLPKLSSVSTELNIGSFSQSKISSPESSSSAHFIGTELFGNRSCKPTKRDSGSSFQLFGQTIQTDKPVQDDFDNNGRTGEDGGKGYKLTEGVGGPLGSSLPYSYGQLHNRLDVQCQRVSTVEACSL